MIDANIYAGYMTAISDRLRFPLADATSALYYITLSKELSTDEFERAAAKVFAEYDQFGFPPPSVFLSALKTDPVVDGASILRQISKRGTPAPHGYLYPNVGQIRETMGDLIADAYATAGAAPRCFADDDTTRSIAAREFQQAMETFAAHPDKERPLIASPVQARALSKPKPTSLADLVDGAMKSITSGDAA